jgi:hypothetical protein
MQRYLALCVGVLAVSAASAQSPNLDERQRERRVAETIQNVRQTANDALAWTLEREAVLRLLSILSGTRPTGDKASGWLVPSRTRYTWAWLAARLDRDQDGAVSEREFDGRREWFQALDRDRDGTITPADLDWSEKAPLAQANTQAKMLFRSIDADGDGRVDAQEWQTFMARLSQGKSYLAQDDLLPLFTPVAKGKLRAKAGATADRDINIPLLRAFFEGDVGSIFEGPRPGTPAPDFTLPLQNGAGKLTLSDSFGKRPVVLVFGSFT